MFPIFFRFIFNWRIIALQSGVGFCCTTTSISHNSFLACREKVLASGTFSEFQTPDSDSNQRIEGMQKEMSSAMKPGPCTSSEDVHSNLILIPELF